MWLLGQKKATEEAARKLAEAERKIVDQAARVVRLEARVGIYTPLLKKKEGSG